MTPCGTVDESWILHYYHHRCIDISFHYRKIIYLFHHEMVVAHGRDTNMLPLRPQSSSNQERISKTLPQHPQHQFFIRLFRITVTVLPSPGVVAHHLNPYVVRNLPARFAPLDVF